MSKEDLIKRLKELIEMSEAVNLRYHGRPDCKNCSLQETLKKIVEEAENE